MSDANGNTIAELDEQIFQLQRRLESKKQSGGSNTYKLQLTYFDAPGRAEPIRMAFAAGNIAFEDVRIVADDWPKLKPTMPFEGLPVLSVDGKLLAQSNAILVFAGKLAGLYPR